MEDCVKTLKKDIKCRDSLIKDLYLLLTDEPMFKSFFIYGHMSCGKSFIIKKLLQYLNYNFSIVNCLEHSTNKSFFEKIIIDLASIELTSENGYKLNIKIDNFVDFITELKNVVKKRSDPIVIVLEKCEKLRDMHENVLPALLKLGELAEINVCTIFSSDVTFEKFYGKNSLCEPIRIHFPYYNNKETKEILFHLTKPINYSEDFYKRYLELFFSMFYRVCRDLNELRYMATLNFEKYVEPIEANLISENDHVSLYKNIRSTFCANLELIYQRMFQTEDAKTFTTESTRNLALSFELPFYGKYLLIAAFLASYNPSTEDKRIFMKEDASKKKRKTIKRKKQVTVNRKNEGPRIFPLERLLAIFTMISDNKKVSINPILMSQITSLCRLGLIMAVGNNDINEPKYKCCVNYDFILVISKNVQFEVNKYLYDRHM